MIGASLLWIGLTTIALHIVYCAIESYFSKANIAGKTIPKVRGGLPFIGHGFHSWWNMDKFLSDCSKKYSGIFQVKLFRFNMVLISDPNLTKIYLKDPVGSFSIVNWLKHLNFEWIFHENSKSLAQSIQIFKKTIPIAGKDDLLLSNIDSEVQILIERLEKIQKNDGDTCVTKLHEETYRFVSRSAYMWLTSMELQDLKMKKMQEFFNLAGQISLVANYLPPWLAKTIFGSQIRKLRQPLVADFQSQIQKHREESSMADSKLIRISLDSASGTDEEIGEYLLSFMAAGLDSTYTLLNQCLANLTKPENFEICEELRQECEKYTNDPKKLLAAPLLNAFVLETARLAPNSLGNFTGPNSGSVRLGDYVIDKDVHFVGLCAQIIMADENSEYQDPKRFNPKRFMGENPENSSSTGLVKWGGGRHGCPARMFSIVNIKMALAHLVINF